MNTNYFYKVILLSSVLFGMSCKAISQNKSEDAKEETKVGNEENLNTDVDVARGFQSNIEAYFNSNTPSKVEIPYETDEEYNHRMQWWKDAKYGMFIHWGLYSILAGEYKGEITPRIAEWIQITLQIPGSEYQKLVDQFNPTEFDADEWVSTIKAAGMKYVVITAKHHDGFALFDSKASEYDVMSTSFKRDIIKELKEACDKQGVKFGVCYSHLLDFEHPDAYVGASKKLQNRMNTMDYDPNKMDRSKYLKEKSFPQLRELLMNYGKMDIIWFDMGTGLDNEEIREFVKICRKLQPQMLISSRVGAEADPQLIDRGMLFDFYSSDDNYFTGDDLAMPWEMPGTTNGSWGYRKDDHEWRSARFVLSSVLAVASRNGNYLLNVDPDAKGNFPAQVVANLKEAGEWLQKNGEAVYGTAGSPIPWNYDWGFETQKPNRVYLNVMNWPKNQKLGLNGILSDIDHVTLLDGGQPVPYEQKGRFLSIDLQGLEPDVLATTFVVHYKDSIVQIAPGISQNRNNDIRLDRIADTYIAANKMSSWKFKVNTPGTYKIQLISNEKGRHSAPEWTGSEQEGSIQVAGKILPVTLKRDEEKTNPALFFYKVITSNIGEIELPKPGTYSFKLKGFNIGARKGNGGLGLDRIELVSL